MVVEVVGAVVEAAVVTEATLAASEGETVPALARRLARPRAQDSIGGTATAGFPDPATIVALATMTGPAVASEAGSAIAMPAAGPAATRSRLDAATLDFETATATATATVTATATATVIVTATVTATGKGTGTGTEAGTAATLTDHRGMTTAASGRTTGAATTTRERCPDTRDGDGGERTRRLWHVPALPTRRYALVSLLSSAQG